MPKLEPQADLIFESLSSQLDLFQDTLFEVTDAHWDAEKLSRESATKFDALYKKLVASAQDLVVLAKSTDKEAAKAEKAEKAEKLGARRTAQTEVLGTIIVRRLLADDSDQQDEDYQAEERDVVKAEAGLSLEQRAKVVVDYLGGYVQSGTKLDAESQVFTEGLVYKTEWQDFEDSPRYPVARRTDPWIWECLELELEAMPEDLQKAVHKELGAQGMLK